MNMLDDKLRIRLEKDLRDRLKRVAEIMKRKEGAVARLAIEEYVDRHDQQNPINGRSVKQTRITRILKPKP